MVHVISVKPEDTRFTLIKRAVDARQVHPTVKVRIPGIDGEQHDFFVRRKSQTVEETGAEFDAWWDANWCFFIPEVVEGLWRELINKAVGLAVARDNSTGYLQFPGTHASIMLATNLTTSVLFDEVAAKVKHLQSRGATEQEAPAAS